MRELKSLEAKDSAHDHNVISELAEKSAKQYTSSLIVLSTVQ